MSKRNRREQASKRDRNEAMGMAFIELRKGSRTEPHRNKARYNRNDYRNQAQRGDW